MKILMVFAIMTIGLWNLILISIFVLQVISSTTANKNCVAAIADADILGFLFLTLHTLPSGISPPLPSTDVSFLFTATDVSYLPSLPCFQTVVFFF